MKNKKIPQRTCVVTREKCDKKDLLRIVKTPEGAVIVDLSGKANGRGAYLKKDAEVIKKAQDKKILEYHLKTTIPGEVYIEAINSINK